MMIRMAILALLLFNPLRAEKPVAIDVEKLDPNMTLEKADAKGVAWFDPREAPFRLTGFSWIEEDKVYRRLPVKPEWEIRAAVDSLANSTAGGQIAFRSDSPKILVRVKLRQVSGMYHMPATGQSGCDLYISKARQKIYHKTSRFSAKAQEYEVEMFSSTGKAEESFLINLPLYNGVESIEVGVKAGSTIKAPLPFQEEGKVVVYGTSITQGGCASRPGMAYPNILSRRFDMEFVNLGFSGNGKGEPALARLISQISDKRLVVLDYEANAGESIRKTLGPFIDLLREADSEIPILVISKIRYSGELASNGSLKAVQARAQFQADLVKEKVAGGDQNLHFLDGATLLGKNADECTVDGVHPTDLGFMRMAESIAPKIASILEIELSE